MSFEEKFISKFGERDKFNDLGVYFFDSTLKKDIGPYFAGETVSCVGFDFNTCKGAIYDNKKKLITTFVFEVCIVRVIPTRNRLQKRGHVRKLSFWLIGNMNRNIGVIKRFLIDNFSLYVIMKKLHITLIWGAKHGR